MATHETLEGLREALARRAAGRGTAAQILARMQRDMLDSGDAMVAAGLPSGQRRAALTDAMIKAQTRDGKRYAECIICHGAVSRTDANGTMVPSNAPMFPVLVTLIPSSLFADVDTLADVAPGTAPRLGYVPGNVAVQCSDCAATWRAYEGRSIVLSADDIDAGMILTSWEGIRTMATRKATEPAEWTASRARRAASRADRFPFLIRDDA